MVQYSKSSNGKHNKTTHDVCLVLTFNRSGAAEARRAHNPEDLRSKRSVANLPFLWGDLFGGLGFLALLSGGVVLARVLQLCDY